MKLTYYKIKCLDDSDIYSIREKTKRAVIETLKNAIQHNKSLKGGITSVQDSYQEYNSNLYQVDKIVIKYKNSFDLLIALRGSEYQAEEIVKTYYYTDKEILNY